MRLPGPVRAAIGLVATAAEEARHLPERAIELPMLAVSTALQMSLRAQQRYARLTARGDQVLRGEPSDEAPEWATFDDPVPDRDSAFDRLDGHLPADVRSFADLFAVTDPDEQSDAAPTQKAPPKRAPAKQPATKKAPAKKAPAAKTTAAKTAAAKNAAAKNAPAKAAKQAAAKAPAPKAVRGRSST